jgi:acyl carrier protein phosphodiesterase
MNWVAHVFLSEPCIHYQLGNSIADLIVKGKTWHDIHPSTEAGLTVHRKIDALTDSHLVVHKSKQRLRDKGYLRAVAIDLSYDYMLIKIGHTITTLPPLENASTTLTMSFENTATSRPISWSSSPHCSNTSLRTDKETVDSTDSSPRSSDS